MNSNYPIPPFWQFPKLRQPPYLQINMTLFVVLECVQDWKRICCRRGTPTSLPSAPCAHAHRWWLVRLMDPLCSPQPGICTPNWCHPSWIQRGCMLAGIASSEAGRTAGEAYSIAWTAGFRDFGSCGFLRGQMGDAGGWGMASFLVGRWGGRYWRGVTLLPSEAHKNLPPSEPATTASIFPSPSGLQALSLSFQPVGLLPQGTSSFQQVQSPER